MRRYKTFPQNVPKVVVEPIPLTAEFYDDLKQRYQVLKTEQAALKLRLKDAREMGDLSENGAYKYAKIELGVVGRQLADISFLLTNGFVPQDITNNNDSSGLIRFGSKVTLRSSNGTVTYTLLSEYEANPATGSISTKSPLGMLLVGKSVGDTIELFTPKGSIRYKIAGVN